MAAASARAVARPLPDAGCSRLLSAPPADATGTRVTKRLPPPPVVGVDRALRDTAAVVPRGAPPRASGEVPRPPGARCNAREAAGPPKALSAAGCVAKDVGTTGWPRLPGVAGAAP